jgi:hypothetical protein
MITMRIKTELKNDLLHIFMKKTFWIIRALQLFLHFLPITSQDNRDSIVFVSLNDSAKYVKCSEVPFGMNHFNVP